MRGLGLNRELEGERALFVGDRGIGGVRGDRRQRRDLFRAAEHLRHLRERCAQLGFVHLREKFGRDRRGHVAAVVEQRDEIGGAVVEGGGIRGGRSEERRGGQGGVRRWRSWW